MITIKLLFFRTECARGVWKREEDAQIKQLKTLFKYETKHGWPTHIVSQAKKHTHPELHPRTPVLPLSHVPASLYKWHIWYQKQRRRRIIINQWQPPTIAIDTPATQGTNGGRGVGLNTHTISQSRPATLSAMRVLQQNPKQYTDKLPRTK